MRRRLWLINGALLVAIAIAGWQIRARWLAADAREQAVLGAAVRPGQMPPPAPAPKVEPLQAAQFVEVAEKLLFARDRNPAVVIEEAPPKPVPPFPAFHGLLDFAGDATAILTPPGKEQKGYRAGDAVGDFKLAAVSRQELVFEWEGKEFRKTPEELKPKEAEEKPAEAQPGSAAAPPAPQLTPQTKIAEIIETQRPKSGGPGLEIGGEVRACDPNDTSPPGTVMGGFRKVVTTSPFGRICRWEPVR